MTNILKPCPYRVHGVRRASWTVDGEYSYSESFMPCMGFECACFHVDIERDIEIAYCDRGGVCMTLAVDVSIDELKSLGGEDE